MAQALPDRRGRKRLATRQRISDVATGLFIRRGFDHVTVDEIAEAADVSRMTVFNHFARKEDMFFDLDDTFRRDLLAALHERKKNVSPIEATRLFIHWAVSENRPYVRFSERGTVRFLSAIEASDALTARARAIRDELTEVLADGLAEAAQQPRTDPSAALAASMLIAACIVAAFQAHRVFRETRDAGQANIAFLALVDRGAAGVKAALKGTPFV